MFKKLLKMAGVHVPGTSCYFCHADACTSGDYYEVHYGGGSSWRQVPLCSGCSERARHCHYCTLHHGAYNCQEND